MWVCVYLCTNTAKSYYILSESPRFHNTIDVTEDLFFPTPCSPHLWIRRSSFEIFPTTHPSPARKTPSKSDNGWLNRMNSPCPARLPHSSPPQLPGRRVALPVGSKSFPVNWGLKIKSIRVRTSINGLLPIQSNWNFQIPKMTAVDECWRLVLLMLLHSPFAEGRCPSAPDNS